MSVYIKPVSGTMLVRPKFRVDVFHEDSQTRTRRRVDFCTCSTPNAALNYIQVAFNQHMHLYRNSSTFPTISFNIVDLSELYENYVPDPDQN